MIFNNETIYKQLTEQGYAVLDAGIERETHELSVYIEDGFQLPADQFYYSLMSNTYKQNIDIRSKIKDVLTPFFESHFINYRTINESFLAKPANTKDQLLLHQDWCYTDETDYAAYNIWIPLTDVSAENGALFFLPGSHLWFNNIRSATLLTARIETDDELKQHIITVPMKMGQVLLFHPAVFHGSHPNNTNKNRIVVTSTVLPAQAPFVYYDKTEQEDVVRMLQLNNDMFLENLEALAFGNTPDLPEINRLPYQHKIITDADLKARL